MSSSFPHALAPLAVGPIRELPLSVVTLTPAEERGDLLSVYGLKGHRNHQRNNEPIPTWSVRYVHPDFGMSQVPHPAPSSTRPQTHSQPQTICPRPSAGHAWRSVPPSVA